MDNFLAIREETGFPANMNNFVSTADDHRFVEGSSDRFSGLEIIKNQFFIVDENPDPMEISTQSFFKPLP